MGLQPFEVRFFFVPKSYLIQSSRTRVHKKVLKIRLKPVHDVSNIIKKYFLCVKSRMGKPLDSKFFKSKKLYFQSVYSQAKQELRGNFFSIKSALKSAQNLLYCSLRYIYKHIGTPKFLVKVLFFQSKKLYFQAFYCQAKQELRGNFFNTPRPNKSTEAILLKIDMSHFQLCASNHSIFDPYKLFLHTQYSIFSTLFLFLPPRFFQLL